VRLHLVMLNIWWTIICINGA